MDSISLGSIRVLSEVFRGYRRHVLILVLLGFVGAALDAIGINAVVPLISFLLGGSMPGDFISGAIMHVFAFVHIPFTFRYLLVFIVSLFLLRAVALASSAYMRGFINAHYFTREISELLRATMKSKWQFMIHQKGGYVQNTIFWDVEKTAELLDRIVLFVQSGTASLMYLMVALNISLPVTLMTIVFGAVILFALRRPLISRIRMTGGQTSVLEKTISQHLIEYLHGFKQVKASGAAEGVIAEAGMNLSQLREVRQKSVFLQGLSGVLLQPISFLFIMGLFAFSYGTHALNLAAFAATLYLIQKIFTSLDATQAFFVTGIQLIPYAENLLSYKSVSKEHREDDVVNGKPFLFEREIAFKNVSLAYTEGSHALSAISCRIPRGTTLGIIGGSGGGKTSFADLLLRLYKPTEGEILVDGVVATDMTLSDWRKNIAYVSQDVFLMNASVAHNIRFYDTDVTDEDVERAAREAHIYDDIMRLPEGFDTVIGDRGLTLSGGQRQRIALARALARKPSVLVLDEVTSALDSHLEKQIQEVISDLHGKVTMVVIAHRVSTVLDADAILVLEKGKVAAQGSPEKMLADPDSYLSKIIALQGAGR